MAVCVAVLLLVGDPDREGAGDFDGVIFLSLLCEGVTLEVLVSVTEAVGVEECDFVRVRVRESVCVEEMVGDDVAAPLGVDDSDDEALEDAVVELDDVAVCELALEELVELVDIVVVIVAVIVSLELGVPVRLPLGVPVLDGLDVRVTDELGVPLCDELGVPE